MFGEPRTLPQCHDHDIEGVGDDDDKSVGRMLLDAIGDLVDDLQVLVEQIVAAHAVFAWKARRHDAHVGARDAFVGVGARELAVRPLQGPELVEVEGLAPGGAAEYVEQDHVSEVLLRGEQGEGAADLSGANHRDLFCGHRCLQR